MVSIYGLAAWNHVTLENFRLLKLQMVVNKNMHYFRLVHLIDLLKLLYETCEFVMVVTAGKVETYLL